MLGNILDRDAENAGKSAGKSFGSNLAGKIKSAIAAAGIGKMLGSAISEGAGLEQSIGGIETLFKDSADTIKQYAADAYATAGLSANAYMETVTSFSASLLQGLGGDTAAAAEVANMALTDMADNANKMGTSMDSIQLAYQGFAKQNYTMLDNLKLGYGGTKTEMERLLADAQAITGVKYDITNLADVYNAIHVIQGGVDDLNGGLGDVSKGLGITGTTAKEASTTISGSMAAVKAAFSNVLGSLTLGQDVRPALEALAQTASTFLFGNLLPALVNILSALPGSILTMIQTAVPEFSAALMEFVPQMQQAFDEHSGELLDQGAQLLLDLINGFFSAAPQITSAAGETISQLANGFVEHLPDILACGQEILTNIIAGIQAALPDMLVAAGDTVSSLLGGLAQHLPDILASGFDLIVSLITGIGNALPDIITAAGEVAATLWDEIQKVDWLQLGKDIIQGLIDGIGSMAGALWDAATNIAKSALDAIKDFFGISSPSRRMRMEVGYWIPPGIAEGITENTAPLTDALHAVADLTTDTLRTNAVALRRSSAVGADGAITPGRPAAGAVYNHYYNQTINTHDSLSPSEMAREAKAFLERCTWQIP